MCIECANREVRAEVIVADGLSTFLILLYLFCYQGLVFFVQPWR